MAIETHPLHRTTPSRNHRKLHEQGPYDMVSRRERTGENRVTWEAMLETRLERYFRTVEPKGVKAVESNAIKTV